MTRLFLILGDQLFATERLAAYKDALFFMAEDQELCTHNKYHKHKIILFLSAMRQYHEQLVAYGMRTIYYKLNDHNAPIPYIDELAQALAEIKATELIHFQIEDRFFAERIKEFCVTHAITETVIENPMFLTSHEEFQAYLKTVKKPFMKTFYERQRKRLGILVDENNKPIGGQWSFDEDNRKKLGDKVYIEPLPQIMHAPLVHEVIDLVAERFPDHPGTADNFWLPTNRPQAKAWLQDFLLNRFEEFGPYEDSISRRSDTINHSILTPVLNLGLLTPDEVVKEALGIAAQKEYPIESVEGFIRQVIGWREFIRGIYHAYPMQGETNFWKHERKLAATWYTGDTGVPPLDDAIKKAIKLGYNHHIERLMIISNIMMLSEVHPKEVHKWFMEHYVDSADWVMGPNVYGMGQMSDGGIFATKPYICGSNYIMKMSDYPVGFWCDIMDGLYWRFIEKNLKYFSSNPRLSMMASMLKKLDPDRRKRIFFAAEAFLRRNTIQADN